MTLYTYIFHLFVGQHVTNSKRSHESIFIIPSRFTLKVCYITRVVFHCINVKHLSFSPANFDASLTRTEPCGTMRRTQTFDSIFGVLVLSRGSLCVRPHPKFHSGFSQSREQHNAWFGPPPPTLDMTYRIPTSLNTIY
ncbi:hypothetical protein B0H14DRAFT_3456248 [Mycena olivaceomarginata]|nr:hypothetical protein B0H14DRAFT_3456248 [Mycena olivaceomarginata]